MTEQEFEQLWQANRQQLLANDEEYQRISKSYTSSSWLDYLVSIGGFVICEKFIQALTLATYGHSSLQHSEWSSSGTASVS